MLHKLQVVPIEGQPYTTPAPDQDKVTLSISDGTRTTTIVVTVRAVEPHWSPSGIRLEGYTVYDDQNCIVVAYYDIDTVSNHLGMAHLSTI